MNSHRNRGPVHRLVQELKELSRATLHALRSDARKTDWDTPGERREYMKEFKRGKRRTELDLLARDRKCPLCGGVKIKSRQWVAFDIDRLDGDDSREAERLRRDTIEGRCAVCRSCAMTHFDDRLWRDR